MRTALCLFGISRQDRSRHGGVIDYRKSIKNYREHLFPYFLSKGIVDLYLCTNTLSDPEREELIHDYAPHSIQCIENHENPRLSRNEKITRVVSKVFENDPYDLICVTRFDLLFAEPLEKANLDLSKMNIVSILEHGHLICDNFYLFPGRMLSPFYGMLLESKEECHHRIKDVLEKKIKDTIHLIQDERCFIADLSFYKIVRSN